MDAYISKVAQGEDLEGVGRQAGGEDLLQGLLQLCPPVQLAVSLPVAKGRREGVLRSVILQALPGQQDVLQALPQHKAPALVSLLQTHVLWLSPVRQYLPSEHVQVQP